MKFLFALLLLSSQAFASTASVTRQAARVLDVEVGMKVYYGLVEGIASCPQSLELIVAKGLVGIDEDTVLKLSRARINTRERSITAKFMYSSDVEATMTIRKIEDGFMITQVDIMSPRGFNCFYR